MICDVVMTLKSVYDSKNRNYATWQYKNIYFPYIDSHCKYQNVSLNYFVEKNTSIFIYKKI